MSQADPSESVDALVAEFLQAHRKGRTADCQAMLRQHPQHAAELSAFLEDYDQMAERFAPLLQLSGGTPGMAAEMATLGQDETAATPPRAGSSFGDYDLLAEVARGGMGVVYKARQKSLNRIVALKMVLGGGADSQDQDRFLVEARAVARLNHPHIVPIYEVGELDGQPYFTMEFFNGGCLRDQIEALRGDQTAIARLMVTVARAVEHAHRRGILHRDLKPTNVLLDERREPHVTDFGLAKQLDAQSDLTQAGAIVGTPSYMAPEQAGAQTDLTTAADVYGLGAVMYELLTGRPPFKGNTPLETIMAATTREPQRPRKLSPSIAADLETICLKCLEKDPLGRYGSAEALADDLNRWLAGQPIQARAVTATERLVKWARRQPLLAGSLGTVAVAVLGLLALAGFLWQNAELRAEAVQSLGQAKTQLAQVDGERQQAEAKKTEAERLAEQQRKLADEQKSLAGKIAAEVQRLQKEADAAEQQLNAARAEARLTTYAADMQLAHAAWRSDNIPTTAALLDRYDNPTGQEDPRGFEWHYLLRQFHGERLSWREEPDAPGGLASIVAMAISPDGTTLATAQTAGNELKLWNLADGTLLRTIELMKRDAEGPEVSNVTGVFFEDEGRTLVAVTRKKIDMGQMMKMVGQAMGKKEKFHIKSLAGALEFQVCTLDGDAPVRIEPFDARRLASSVFPVMAGAFVVPDQDSIFMVMAMDRSADGKFLALAGAASKLDPSKPREAGRLSGGRLIIWDLEKGQIRFQQDTPTMLTAVAFSPKGDAVAIGTSSGAIGVANTDFTQPPRPMVGHTAMVYALQFTSDGKRLLSGGLDSLILLWDVATAKELHRFRGHTAAVLRIELSADNQTMVSGSTDGSVKVWDLARDHSRLLLTGHGHSVGSLSFTDEGRQLISADQKGNIKTWQLSDGAMIGSARPADTQLGGPRLSRSGRLLLWPEGNSVTLVVRDLASDRETRLTWKDHKPYWSTVSLDDKLVAATDLGGGGLVVWNLADGQQLATLDELNGPVMSLTFSSDNKLLAAAHATGIVLWDWQSEGAPRIIQIKDAPTTAANSASGNEPNTAQSQDTKSTGTIAVAFSADDRYLAASASSSLRSGETTVRIWDLKTDRPRTQFVGAGQVVRHLAFSPDGRRLATGGTTSGQRGLLKLWDTASGREVFSPTIPPGTITAIAWSPDGMRLAAATAQFDLSAALAISGQPPPSNIYVWDATPVGGAVIATHTK